MNKVLNNAIYNLNLVNCKKTERINGFNGINNQTLVVLINSGVAKMQLDGELVSLKSKDIMVINNNCVFSNFFKCSEDFESIQLIYENLHIKEEYNKNFSKIDGLNLEHIPGIFNSIYAEFKKSQKNSINIVSSLSETLYYLLNRENNCISIKSLKNNLDPSISIVKEYIEKNYMDDITLDKLSKVCHLNRFTISHSFKKQVGMSPINYLLWTRIEISKGLMENKRNSITDVSISVGFTNPSHFSQVFKKITGLSPSKYKSMI